MKLLSTRLIVGFAACASSAVLAGPVYHPPGSNLTYGDVTHGQRVQSASSNPAAAAADRARREDDAIRGVIVSTSAGIEYGNVQDLFDFYDSITQAYAPSEPGEGGGPGQEPGDKPDGGINIGDILDQLDPNIADALDALASEVARQAAILGVIATEGYGRAWLSADIPFVMGDEFLGGTWTFGANWSGNAKSFGVAEQIDFDREAARQAIEDWLDTLPSVRPETLAISDDIVLTPTEDAVLFAIRNDSSLVTKATQSTEVNVGYSRPAVSTANGALFLGVEGRLYMTQLSRLSVRFGDITNSEDLFDAIRDADFRSDTDFGVDLGALWVADNYQLGAQLTNVNRPTFDFPEVNLDAYRNADIIDFLQSDQRYVMDRQLKLEASFFSRNRRWSGNIGLDANAARDPLGDDYQWLTVSTGYSMDNWWLPNVRLGYRQNLAGTELSYLSVGFTAFKFVNFDIASALDTVSISGTTLPQGLMTSIGFQINW
jgi:hypothetical protein